jgi:EAL domain-containing protein (putative c-di-GMP-specific phosphodiesterase class I)
LYLNFQPLYNIIENKVWGVEVLLRWENPYLGKVSPGEFISIAEENQSIVEIGDWVLEQGCKFLKKLRNEGYKEYKISINISPVQLIQVDFEQKVLETIAKNNIPYHCVELEITETILMESYNLVAHKLKILRENGVSIALDDFGNGYCSLSYLKKLPINTLKLDKSFMDDFAINRKKQKIVNSIIELGKTLELEIVVEGVETKEQFELIELQKVNRIQGYYYAKPMDEDDVLNLLKTYPFPI